MGLLGLTSCATVGERSVVSDPPQPESEELRISDPFEPLNRYFLEFNFQLDGYFIRPVADVYARVTPAFLRQMVSNFSRNLSEPFIAANQLLQGKPRMALSDVGRFAVNSTLGIGGLFDPASEMNLVRHDEDLGQTLAIWGVGAGPYLVLPLLGPTTFRDAPSGFVEGWTRHEILQLADAGNQQVWIEGVSAINERSKADPLEGVRERAIDPYIFIREAYFERRRFLIHDGDPPFEPVKEWIIDLPPEEP